ncbi:MAG TPA: DUF4139 domain-containing protein [Kofleriaceae bacterium]|nr:DUF4139 domain-containing protein [Kofleriaceae bacterium]
MTTRPTRSALRTLAGGALGALVLGLAGHALADHRDARLAVSVWSTGGEGYGGPGGGAFVVQRRDVDVDAGGLARFPGVAATIDPATVEVRSLTDAGASVVEQRLIGDQARPDELLAHQVGHPVTVTLEHGEVKGVLRAVSFAFLAIETDGPGGKAIELVRRGDQLLDLAFGAVDLATEPTLQWTLAGAHAGTHSMEVSYHADGLSWTPSYTAVLGDDDAVDFSAWATIANRSGLDLDGAQVTLMYADPSHAASPPTAFALARPVDLAADHDLQVELTPRRTGVHGKRVTVYEAAADLSAGYTTTPAADCYGYAPTGASSELALELDGGGTVLPPGRLRVLRRSGADTTLARDDKLRVDAGTGAIRIKLDDDDQVTGDRKQDSCEADPTGRALREAITVSVTNHGKAAADVVVREYLFRWRNWHIEAEDVKGERAGAQAQEYRLRVPAGGNRTVSYTVVYAW